MATDGWMRRDGLLERGRQLELVGAALDAAANGVGGAVGIEGPAGLGKTALLDVAAGEAAERGLSVRRARGLELEIEHPFGAVRQLLAPVVRDADDGELLTGAARLARPLLVGAQEPQPAVDNFAALHGLYWLLANIAARAPLALLVDDAHWLDDPSVRFLSFLLPRLEELPVALVIASRPPAADQTGGLLARPEPRSTRLDPLSEAAVMRLVRAALDRDDCELTAACAEASAGNPFFLAQLLNELRAHPDAATAERVRRLAPAGVARAVLARLMAVGPDAVALTRAVAVLGDGAPLPATAELAGLDVAKARVAADALVAADVFAPHAAPAFAHPLVRQAVYEDLPVFRRAEAHRRAARLLDAAGASPDAVAAQLLDAPPEGDAWSVHALRDAAAGALRRGAPAIAADLLERAVAEPPPAAERGAVLLELAGAEALAGRSAASERFEMVLAIGVEPAERARAAAGLGRLLTLAGRPADAIALLERALAQAEGSEHEPELLAELLSVAQVQPGMRPRLRERLDRLRTAPLSPDTPVGRRLLAVQALERALACDPLEQVLAAASAALADGRLLAEETADSPTYHEAVTTLGHVGECDEAERLRDAAIEDARARGSVFAYAISSSFRGIDRLRAGRIVGAEDDLRAGLDLVREHYPPGIPLIGAFLVEALVARGALDDARAAVAALAPAAGGPWPELWCSARGRLRLAEGNGVEAATELVESTRIWESYGVRHTMFDADGARALVQAGRPELASELAQRELAGARRSGAPRLLGIALRAAGLVRGGEQGIELLSEAAAVLDGSAMRFDLAGSLVDLGAALRRTGRRVDARERLAEGLALAADCGAEPLAALARAELAILGARPRDILRRGADALTPSERRVAQMAASGMQNREIAQALFVTIKTVETQLSSCYRRLGIASRRELAGALELSRT